MCGVSWPRELSLPSSYKEPLMLTMKLSATRRISPVFPQTTGICSFSSARQSVPRLSDEITLVWFHPVLQTASPLQDFPAEQVENHRSKIQNTDSSCHVIFRCESLAFIPGHTPKSPGRVSAQFAICSWGVLGLGGSDATASAPYLPAMEQLPPTPTPRLWRATTTCISFNPRHVRSHV